MNTMVSTETVQRLLDMGFRRVGEWKLAGSEMTCFLHEEAESKNILYAFESRKTILYIGKTTQSLRARMYGYQNPGPTQSTNIRNHGNLKKILGDGEPVSILALPDHGLLYYGGFHLNLAAGLEDDLVSKIKPRWNKTGA
jgi:hypothetical protein